MDAKKALLDKREKLVLSPKSALSTGSTLLNLACTDHPDYGFIKGAYYYLVGDSVSGKTWVSMSCFAESTLNENFKNYRLIFDDVEGGALMDIRHFFGKEAARRIEPPAIRNGQAENSDTIESFYYHVRDLLRQGRPFIYVLDSQDALTSSAATKKFDKQKKAAEKGEDAKGSYGDGKAKYHSENIRWVLAGLRKTKSILIIIGQTRDNLEMFSFEKKTRSGGRALKFYASIEIWTAAGKKIVKPVRGRKRTVGINCIAEVKKNRVTGKVGRDRSAVIPIYYGYGIDDVGSCVDFMIAENEWPKKKGENGTFYKATDLQFRGTRSEIITYVEQAGLESKLKEAVARVWKEIEVECQLVHRKKRYE